MRSLQKDPKATNRVSGRAHTSGGQLEDPASEKLAKIGKVTGNQAVMSQLGSAEGKRDELLAFICQRLKIVNEIQQVELAEYDKQEEWFREVAKGESGFHLPDATRWHDTASFYMQAAQAMCAGNLGRGADLIEKAQEAERAAMESVPHQVESKIMPAKRKIPEQPEAAVGVASGATCPTKARPMDLKYGEEILAVIAELRDNPALQNKDYGAWWEGLEEEEEEEDGAAG